MGHPLMKKKYSYAVYGALFGALFPICAMVLDLIAQGLPLTLGDAYKALATQPLHWIISSAPLFLGLFAAIAGARQDAVLAEIQKKIELNGQLEAEIKERTKAENTAKVALASENIARETAEQRQQDAEILAHNLDWLFRTMPIGIAALDAEGQVLSANDAFKQFVENSDDFTSRLIYETSVLSPESGAKEIRLSLAGKDKYAMAGRVVFTGLGETHSWVFAADLTDQKRQEAQLLQTSKLATLGEMATGTAHELNQPLNHIKLLAANIENLAAKPEIDPVAVRKKAQAIKESSDRAGKIIHHMRTFGRTAPSELEDVSIQTVVDGALLLLAHKLRQQDITMSTQIPADLPLIHAQEGPLEQVLINMINNAIDAISDTSPRERLISLEASSTTADVTIVIKDTGGGMSQHELQNIFVPFFTTKEVGHGTGLGGSISYGVIKSFSGHISATNDAEGAVITIVLPRPSD